MTDDERKITIRWVIGIGAGIGLFAIILAAHHTPKVP